MVRSMAPSAIFKVQPRRAYQHRPYERPENDPDREAKATSDQPGGAAEKLAIESSMRLKNVNSSTVPASPLPIADQNC